MKVLLYTHEFPPFLGGLATTSYKIAKGCRDAGLDVTVLAPKYSGGDREFDNKLDFRVIRMTGLTRNHGVPSPVKEVAGFFSLSKALSEIQPGVVLFVTREAHVAGGLLPGFPFKVIIRVAGYEAIRYLLGNKFGNRLLGLPMKRLYMKAHKIISPSHSTAELLEQGGIPREKTEVIYNGVNSDMLSRKPNPDTLEKLRKKFNIQGDEKVILTVARLVPGKGQDSVIKALPKVTKEYDRVKYLIVGEGRYKEELKTLADRERVSPKVIFAGPVPHSEVINFYDLCDLFIMPNRSIEEKENIEGLPNVVLEAASREKPVITGIPGGAKEAIKNGASGFIINGENPDEIASRILDLLRDDVKAREFGVHGKKRIQEMFTEEKMINSYLNVIGESG